MPLLPPEQKVDISPLKKQIHLLSFICLLESYSFFFFSLRVAYGYSFCVRGQKDGTTILIRKNNFFFCQQDTCYPWKVQEWEHVLLSVQKPHSQEPQSSLTFKVVCSYYEVRAGAASRLLISPWGLIDTGGRRLSIAAGQESLLNN